MKSTVCLSAFSEMSVLLAGAAARREKFELTAIASESDERCGGREAGRQCKLVACHVNELKIYTVWWTQCIRTHQSKLATMAVIRILQRQS